MDTKEIIEEKCCNCKNYKRVKELVENNGKMEWEWFHICDLFINEPNGWGMVVDKDGKCELFIKK